ncbi:hypothetical protein PI125_g22624 [Phytophthora idaei]|nr:hypothetical protein PI125_g22624 [Phytophthora idaei]
MDLAFSRSQRDTFLAYKLRTSNSIRDRNRTRIQQAEARGTQPKHWDEGLRHYTKGWTCTHGGQFKSNGQGGGLRTFHVKSHDSTHNHPIDKNVFNTYAETRKITSPVTRSGAKRKTLLRYLKDISGKPIQPQYVNNMISEMRRESYTSPDDNIRMTELLQDFSEGPDESYETYGAVVPGGGVH